MGLGGDADSNCAGTIRAGDAAGGNLTASTRGYSAVLQVVQLILCWRTSHFSREGSASVDDVFFFDL